MEESNTADVKINWKKVNQDNEAKLRALKKWIKEWESQLPFHFYMVAINIIDNKDIK